MLLPWAQGCRLTIQVGSPSGSSLGSQAIECAQPPSFYNPFRAHVSFRTFTFRLAVQPSAAAAAVFQSAAIIEPSRDKGVAARFSCCITHHN